MMIQFLNPLNQEP